MENASVNNMSATPPMTPLAGAHRGRRSAAFLKRLKSSMKEERDDPKEDACKNHLRQEEPAEHRHELERAVEIGVAKGSRHLIADNPRDKRGEEHVVT